MESCVVRERFVCLVMLFGCCAGEFVGEMRTCGLSSRLILCCLFQDFVMHTTILQCSDSNLDTLALGQPNDKQERLIHGVS